MTSLHDDTQGVQQIQGFIKVLGLTECLTCLNKGIRSSLKGWGTINHSGARSPVNKLSSTHFPAQHPISSCNGQVDVTDVSGKGKYENFALDGVCNLQWPTCNIFAHNQAVPLSRSLTFTRYFFILSDALHDSRSGCCVYFIGMLDLSQKIKNRHPCICKNFLMKIRPSVNKPNTIQSKFVLWPDDARRSRMRS